MLSRVDRDTIAAILGPDWEKFALAPEPRPAARENPERKIDTSEQKPKQ